MVPFRPSPSSRIASILAAAAALAVGSAGCDNEESQANKRLQQKLQEAQLASYAENGAENARSLLAQATSETAASPAQKAHANALVGQASYAAAVDELDELGEAEAVVVRQIANISRVGADLTLDSSSIEAFRASNPAGNDSDKPIQTIQANKQKFQQQAGQTQQKLNEVGQQIQTVQSRIADLEQKHTAARNQAADLLEKSDAAARDSKPEDSLNLFKQGAEARALANRLGTDLGHAQSELARLQGQQAAYQADLKTLADSTASADRQLQHLQSVWADTQKLIEERGNSLKAALGEQGIAGQTKMLNEAQKKADDLRTSIADTHLQAAIDAFSKAASEAQQLALRANTAASANPGTKAAWDRLAQLHSRNGYQLDQARALQLRGTLHLRNKELLEGRKRVVDALNTLVKPVNLTLPAELASANVEEEIKTAHSKAEGDFKAAEELLNSIADSGRDKHEQNAALSLRSATRFGLYSLTRNDQHLTDAKSDLQQLAEKGVTLSALPSVLTTGLRTAPAPSDAASPDAPTPAPEGTPPPANPQ